MNLEVTRFVTGDSRENGNWRKGKEHRSRGIKLEQEAEN